MDVTVSDFKRCSVVNVKGRIDSSTVPSLTEALKSLLDAGKYKIVMDMTDVTFISSAGWWLMIDTQKTCKRYKRGELILACLDKQIRKSLEMVGMGDYFQMFDDVTTAVGNF